MPDMVRPVASAIRRSSPGSVLASISRDRASTYSRVSRFSAVAMAVTIGSMDFGPRATSLSRAFCTRGLPGLPLDLTSAISRSARYVANKLIRCLQVAHSPQRSIVAHKSHRTEEWILNFELCHTARSSPRAVECQAYMTESAPTADAIRAKLGT